jgi:hypothetical protein
MANSIKKKKVPLKKEHDALHLKLAFKLGRTVRNVSKTMTAVKKSAQGHLSKKQGQKKKKMDRLNVIQDGSAEPVSPILKEIKAIADISGLTAAIEEMNEISLEHADHPVINELTARIEQLSPDQKEMLSRKFIDKLRSNPYFNNSMPAFPSQAKITEEDCQKISDAFIESIFYTLEDVGMTPEERKFLQKFSNDMTRPINELVQFYLHPKTFSQKVKRLWRMQRIFIRMIKLIHMTNALAMANDEALRKGFAPDGSMPSHHWSPGALPVILSKDQSEIEK